MAIKKTANTSRKTDINRFLAIVLCYKQNLTKADFGFPVFLVNITLYSDESTENPLYSFSVPQHLNFFV